MGQFSGLSLWGCKSPASLWNREHMHVSRPLICESGYLYHTDWCNIHIAKSNFTFSFISYESYFQSLCILGHHGAIDIGFVPSVV